MTIHVELRFTLDGAEWTEGYYFQPNALALRTTFDRLVTARMKLLAPPAILVEGRVVDVDNTRFPEVYDLNLSGDYREDDHNFTLLRNYRVPAYPPEVVLLIGWQTASKSKRMMAIGGIPDQEAANRIPSRRWGIEPSFQARVNRFRDALLDPALSLQIKELRPTADLARARVERVDTNADGLYRIRTVENFPAIPKEEIRFMGSRGNNLSRARGLRRVVFVEDERTFVINRGPLPEDGEIRYSGGAQVVKVGYQFSAAEWRKLNRTETEFFGFVIFARFIRRPGYALGSRQRGGRSAARRGRSRKRD